MFPYLARLFNLKVFIETGWGYGDTLAFVHPSFEECWSIEMADFKFKMAEECFRYVSNVHLVMGDSRIELPKILRTAPPRPTLFWLDAHGGENPVDPLKAELEAIRDLRPDALVAIDDVGQNTHHDPGLSELGSLDMPGWYRDYRFGQVMFMHRGQYPIPQGLG